MFRKSHEAYSNLSRDFSDKMFFIDKSRYLHYGRGFSRSEYSTRFLFAFRTVWYPFLPWGAAHSFRNLKKIRFYRKTVDFPDFWFRIALPTANPRPNSDSRFCLVGSPFFSRVPATLRRRTHCEFQQQTENPPGARGHLVRDLTVPNKILLRASFRISSVDRFSSVSVPQRKHFRYFEFA